MDKKIKHLEMIQAVINRMAMNSFILKRWSVILVSAIFALTSTKNIHSFIFIAYFPALAFWLLDGYFLHQERLFRKLYDEVRLISENEVDFSMNTGPYKKEVAPWRTTFSYTLLIFHGSILVVISVAWIINLC